MNGPLPKWLPSILCSFVRLVRSIGVAGLAAGRLRDRDGTCRAACSGEREVELPFSCSCHELLSFTSEALQALPQLANITISPQATSFPHPPAPPAFCLALLQVMAHTILFKPLLHLAAFFHPGDAHNHLFSAFLPPTCLDAWSRLSHCHLLLSQCFCSFGTRLFPVELRVLSPPALLWGKQVWSP